MRVLLLVQLQQLGVAAHHLEGFDGGGIRIFRPGSGPAGGLGEGEQVGEEERGGLGFLAILGGDADFLKKRLQL